MFVGSETIWSLIDRLAKVNNFTSYSDSPEVKEVIIVHQDSFCAAIFMAHYDII